MTETYDWTGEHRWAAEKVCERANAEAGHPRWTVNHIARDDAPSLTAFAKHLVAERDKDALLAECHAVLAKIGGSSKPEHPFEILRVKLAPYAKPKDPAVELLAEALEAEECDPGLIRRVRTNDLRAFKSTRAALAAIRKALEQKGPVRDYARRYALVTAFGVPVEDDDGNAASRRNAHAEQPGQGMPDAEWAKLVQLIEATKSDRGWLIGHYGVENLRHLNQTQYADAIQNLTNKLAGMAKAETNKSASFGEILDDEIPY